MLEGKTALITGSSKGIGRAIAETFAKNGARVFINARKKRSLDELLDQIKNKYNVEVHPIYFDVSDPVEVKNGFKEIFDITRTIDILVNNAGILRDALIGMVTSDFVQNVFSTNTYGVIYCSQYASRMMARQARGSIINISSIVGIYGNEGQTVYGGSKAATIGITKSLAKELASAKIRVNAIAPGFIDTDMVRSLPINKFEERLSSIKMKRIGTPQDVANVALFLASDLSTYVTGQIIGVDGGMLI